MGSTFVRAASTVPRTSSSKRVGTCPVIVVRMLVASAKGSSGSRSAVSRSPASRP